MTVTIDGLTKARMLEIEAASVVGGVVNGLGHLILTRHDGTPIDAGSVIGPQGPPYVNGVDTVSDQTIGGFKTLSSQLKIATGGGSSLKVGKTAAGQGDALNITPYGAAAVVLASGAERDGANNDYARAASATQIELLNSTINFFANTGLVAGVAYGRQKVFSIDNTGMLVLPTGPAAGPSIWLQRQAASMGAGSIIVSRPTPATQHQSIVFAAGIAYNFIVGRKAGSDALSFGYDGGGGFVETAKIDPGGSLYSSAQVHQFGIGGMGAAGAYLRIDGTANETYLRAFGSTADVPLILQPQGNGVLQLRNGGGYGIFTIYGAGQVVVNVGNGGAISQIGLDVQCSPNTGGFAGLRIKSNWGAGGGGNPIRIENASGLMFDMDGNGVMEWGPGANIAGMFQANASAGGGQAVPATVVGFMLVNINGTPRKIPYFAN